MEWIRGEYSKLISFVTAQPDDVKQQHKHEHENGRLGGKEARNFYEDLVGESNAHSTEEHSTDVGQKIASQDIAEILSKNRKIKSGIVQNISLTEKKLCKPKKRKSETVQNISSKDDAEVSPKTKKRNSNSDITELDINRFLRFAQEGNLQQVKCSLNKGVDIDSQDGYGWTGLMCASHNGQIEAVKYLLSVGAGTDIFDINNQSVKDIANNAGHKRISEYIEKWQKGIIQSDVQENTLDTREQFYCEKCKCNFSDMTVKVHELSMVHLFNSKKRAKEDPFLLPFTNKGYKMMIQSGWDGRKGLGSEGQGQKYPVKTILKRDRKCLGSEKEEKPKITHFNANETKAIQRNPERKLTKRVLNKRQQRVKERKQKHWERNLRTSMSVDF